MNYLRRKKYLIVFILLLLTIGWLFRLDIVLWFQHFRLKSINCTSVNNKLCQNKIWAHRVNSLERFNKLDSYFSGVEIDVVYDSLRNDFLVYHPPFEGRIILLESFLGKITRSKKRAWIDLRHLSKTSYIKAYSLLDALNKKWNFKELVIIEIYDKEIAAYFAEKGFNIAVNIPVDLLNNEKLWQEFAATVSPKITYVSQEDIFYPQLKKFFPGKKIVTWAVAFKNYFDLDHLERLVNDSSVEVVLVNVKSRYRY